MDIEKRSRLDSITFTFDAGGVIRGADVEYFVEIVEDGAVLSNKHECRPYDPTQLPSTLASLAQTADLGIKLTAEEKRAGSAEGERDALKKLLDERDATITEQTNVIRDTKAALAAAVQERDVWRRKAQAAAPSENAG